MLTASEVYLVMKGRQAQNVEKGFKNVALKIFFFPLTQRTLHSPVNRAMSIHRCLYTNWPQHFKVL